MLQVMSGSPLLRLACLLSAVAYAGPEPSREGEILYLSGPELVREEAGGKVHRFRWPEARCHRLRATSKGTLLSWTGLVVHEMDREGRSLGKATLDAPGRQVLSADLLPDGSFWVLTQGKGSEVWVFDRSGKTLRTVALAAYVGSARALPDGGIVGVSHKGVYEFDRDGKERRRIPLEEGMFPGDVEKTPDGRYLICADTSAIESKRTGVSVKAGCALLLDEGGKVLVRASHPCPVSVQGLPRGGLLVGAG